MIRKLLVGLILAIFLVGGVTAPILATSTVEEETRYSVVTYNSLTRQYAIRLVGFPRYVEDADHPIDTNWYSGKIGEYTAGNNLLTAYVMNTKVTVGDPWVDRRKDGKLTKATESKQAVWDPKVFLDGEEVKLTIKAATLIGSNTLEWDYGICKRQLKLIAGGIVEEYIFNENPGGDIIIKSSPTAVELIPSGYYAIDANNVNLNFTVVGGEKRVPATAFDNASYPVVIDDTFLTSGTSWQVPADWNSFDNSIECIGGGRDGTDNGGYGGGGGGYSKINYLALTPLSYVSYQVGGEGGDTYFVDTATVLAKGGNRPAGGQASAGVGDVKYSGGDGGSGYSYYYLDIYWRKRGGGGGGAAGLYGDGEDGLDGDNTGAGGDGDAGYGGAGGGRNNPGGAGTEYDATHGSGGGGGGGSRHEGGDGGLYGGAGGGGATYEPAEGFEYYDGGLGKQGLIVIIYTVEPPTVTAQAASSVEDTTATTNGNITDSGSADCDKRGVVYDTSTHADPGDVAPGASGYSNYAEDTGTFGVGAFTKAISSLPPGTTIYYRMYAHNSGGYDYSNTEISFLTKPAAPTNIQATDGVHTDKVVITWTKSTGATGYKVYEGVNLLDTLGDVATYNDMAAPAGIITPGTATASDGTSPDHVTLSLAGESVADGASRIYKVVALNGTGDSDDSATNEGYRDTGAITYQWQRSAADSDASYSPLSGATTDPYNDTGAPATGEGRWYYCVVSSTGASNSPADSTHDRGRKVGAPELTTLAVTGFDRTWVIANGYIDDDGTSAITEVGFDYGLTDAYGSSFTVEGSWTTGDSFLARLDGLSPATVYYYRFKAKNDAWGYGQNMYFSTKGSAVIYEYLNTGGNVDGDDIYGNNWAAQQFTCGTTSHTITHARVYLKRVLLPGDIYLELYYADALHKPTGAAITTKVLDGDSFALVSTWYEFDLTETTLEAGLEYALVVIAPNGDASNYIEWKWDSDGGLADAIASLSVDGGISWTVDAGGADYLFEIWGNPITTVEGAQVFSSYIETGDWLIALTYKNEYIPYYPDENPATYFVIQLLDGSVIKAQTSCLAWEYKPGSIYLAKTLADTLEWGATDYTVRMYGLFGTHPCSDYLLVAADWQGAATELLDSWVISQAKAIGDDIGIALVIPIADQGEVLNSYGHAMFSIGIPYLNEVRPELFEMVSQKPPYTEEDYTGDLQAEADWEVRLGPEVSGFLTDAGDLISVDGDVFGGFLIFLGFLGAVIGLGLAGHLVVGLSLGYPILLIGGWFDLVSWVIIGVVTFFAACIFVYKVWLTR